jgi:DNA-directed RNA polymerase subunit beta'
VAGGSDITQGLPRVEELFEARNQKGQAYISEVAGTVDVWEDGKKYVVQVTPEQGSCRAPQA